MSFFMSVLTLHKLITTIFESSQKELILAEKSKTFSILFSLLFSLLMAGAICSFIALLPSTSYIRRIYIMHMKFLMKLSEKTNLSTCLYICKLLIHCGLS